MLAVSRCITKGSELASSPFSKAITPSNGGISHTRLVLAKRRMEGNPTSICLHEPRGVSSRALAFAFLYPSHAASHLLALLHALRAAHASHCSHNAIMHTITEAISRAEKLEHLLSAIVLEKRAPRAAAELAPALHQAACDAWSLERSLDAAVSHELSLQSAMWRWAIVRLSQTIAAALGSSLSWSATHCSSRITSTRVPADELAATRQMLDTLRILAPLFRI